MKRIIPLALICVILVVSLVPKASAVESTFVDLLDFSYANGYDSNKVWYVQGHGIRSVMNSLSLWQVEYIDILFSVPDGHVVNGVKVGFTASPDNATSLTVVNVSGNLYRAYGHVSDQTRMFYTWVDITNGTWVVFHSYRVSTSDLTGVDEKATCQISAYDYWDTINYNPSDLINYRYFIGANDPTLNSLHLWITCANWRKYDYLDFMVGCDISSVNSIEAGLGDTFIPIEINYLDNGGTIENHYTIQVRIDLTGVDRSSTEGLFLSISGQVNSGSTNFISMEGCRGFVSPTDIDSDNVWFRRFFDFFQNDLWFNLRSILEQGLGTLFDISSKLSPSTSSGNAFKEDSAELITGLGDVSASMDSVQRPSMDSINADFTGDISDASVLMAGLFSEVIGIPWLSTIILASCTLGLISYILYGKE